ncbi:MAG: prepilin-type N-terminal cleavage/methylation domain-containing protein, partial [Romboutsia sp.]|nr:prepilin-type N-terminal cleavage/methylation domain-containing protein [Romboutsia sp.]
MNLKSLNKKKREGFTLIEMVMVVVIIGVLSSTAMMKYGDVQTNAKIKADCATASTIATATTMAISDGVTLTSGDKIVGELVKEGYLQS